MKKFLLYLCCILVFGVAPIAAQDSGREIITVDNASLVAPYTIIQGYGRMAYNITFSPDSAFVAVAESDWQALHVVWVWDIEAEAELWQHSLASTPLALAYHPDGSVLVVVIYQSVILLDSTTGEEIMSLPGPTSGDGDTAAFNPDGTQLAVTGGGEVSLWDTETWTEQETLAGVNAFNQWTTCLTADLGVVVFGGSLDGGVYAETVVTDERVYENRELHGNGIADLQFDPEDSLLGIALFGSEEVLVLDWETQQTCYRLTGYVPISLAWSPDGTILASGGARGDNMVRLWEAETGAPLTILEGHSTGVGLVVFSPDGTMLASGGGYDDNTVHLWAIPAS